MKNLLLNNPAKPDSIEAALGAAAGGVRLPPSKEELAAQTDRLASELMSLASAVLAYRRDHLKQKLNAAAVMQLLELTNLAKVPDDQELPQDLRKRCAAYLAALPGFAAGQAPGADARSRHLAICTRVVKSLRGGKSMLDILKGK